MQRRGSVVVFICFLSQGVLSDSVEKSVAGRQRGSVWKKDAAMLSGRGEGAGACYIRHST